MTRRDRAQRIAAKAAGNPITWIAIIGLIFSWPIVRSIQAAADLPDRRPTIGTVPEFSLTDHAEEELSTESLRGVVWIASFTFTKCKRCTATMDQMRVLQSRLKQMSGAVKLVTLTLDPVVDTPGVFAAYAKRQRASTRIWSFVSGAPDEMDALYEAFGVAPAPQMRVFLIDRDSGIRGYYDLSDPAAQDLLVRDAGLLVNRGY